MSSKHIDLQPHNIKAYNEVKAMLETDNRVAVIQATGTGKSYIIMQLLEDYDEKDKLIIAPSNDIIKQFRENEYWTGNKVKCITYQKLALMHKDGKMKRELFGELKVIAADEMHRTGAESWGESFKALLEMFPEAKVIGSSATPIRYLDNNRDMVEEIFHGNTAGNLDLAEAIIQGIVPSPIYVSSLYNIKEEIEKREHKINKVYKSKAVQQDKIKLLDRLNKIRLEWESVNGVELLLHRHTIDLVERDKGLKVVVFCTDTDRAEAVKPEVYSWFKKAYPQLVVNLYSYHHKAKNYKMQFKNFRNADLYGNIHVLITVDKLNEGVHMKDVSTLIMLRKTMSNTVYFQQLGRAISTGNDKAVIFDLVNNCEEVGVSAAFWDKIRQDIVRNDKEYKDMSQGVKVEIYEYVKDTLSLLRKIDARIGTPVEVMLEQVRRAVKNGEDINKLSSKSAFSFVRTILHENRTQGSYINAANELREMGAVEYLTSSWTAEEDSIIRQYYPKHGTNIEDKLPGRTKVSIQGRARTLELYCDISWNKQDIDILKKYYKTEGLDINKRLSYKREPNHIYRKASQLGLTGSYDLWSEEEDNIIKKYYPMQGIKKVMELIPGRSKIRIRARVTKLGLKFNAVYWTSEEDAILKQNYAMLGTKVQSMLTNKTIDAIKNRAHKFNVKYTREDNWSAEEDAIIYKNYISHGIAYCVSILTKKSRSSIYNRAKKLKII